MSLLHEFVSLATTLPSPFPSPSASPSGGGSGGNGSGTNPWVPWATFGAALVAAAAAIWATFMQRRTGRETVAAARKANEVNAESASAAGKRSDAESRFKRYQDAAASLGDESTGSAPRLAAVYALAQLADDWPDQRQVIVNLLCAYLRSSSNQSPKQRPGEEEVLSSIVGVISEHFKAEAEPSWSDCAVDFHGAEVSGCDFRNAYFRQTVNFRDVTFSGLCLFDGASFEKGAIFERSRIEAVPGEPSVLRFEMIKNFGRLDMRKFVCEPGAVLFFAPAKQWMRNQIDLSESYTGGQMRIFLTPQMSSDVGFGLSRSVLVEGGELSILLARGSEEGPGPLPHISLRGLELDDSASIYVQDEILRRANVRWSQGLRGSDQWSGAVGTATGDQN